MKPPLKPITDSEKNMNAEVVKLVPLTDRELEDIQFSALDKMMELNRNLKAKRNTSSVAETQKEIARLGKVVEKCSSYYSRGKT